jgi:hypothetical protein
MEPIAVQIVEEVGADRVPDQVAADVDAEVGADSTKRCREVSS